MKALGILLILIGLPFLFVPIIGIPLIIIGIIVILSSIGDSNAEKTAQAIARNQMPAPSHEDDDKWNALVKYDDDIAAACKTLAPYGDSAIQELRTVYLSLNDKSKLDVIVRDIEASFRSDTAPSQNMD